MEHMPFVLDISSDEEEEEEEEEEACMEKEGGRSIEYDWIKEFLGMSDEEQQSDEVVVVGEVKRPERNSKCCSISTAPVKDVNVDDDDDDEEDDCIILDGDPENLVTSVDQAPTGSDELLVVGEKGQIACRDYPHPRHLCGNFPFSSTPHERHCDQCHCYVCDSLAPCLKWGTGLSSTDHCHATDKFETWKTLRTNFKLGKTAPLPASTNYGTLHDVGNPQRDHILPLDIMRLSPNSMLLNQTSMSTATRTCSSLNLIPQNQASRPIIMRTCSSRNSSLHSQVSRPSTIPVCSTATNFTIPHDANHGRCQGSGSTLVRNRYQSHSFPRQLLGVRNHVIQRERGRGTISLGPQFLRSHMMSKEVGSVGSNLTLNHSTHHSSGFRNQVNPAWQYDRYHAATGFSNNRTHYGQNDVWVPKNVLYPQPNSEGATLSCLSNYTTPYETQAYYQSNDSQNFYGSCIQGNGDPSSYVACLNRNQHLNEHQIGSQNETACANIIKCGVTRQDACQQKPHDESQSESARKADFSAFDSCWAENTSQSVSYLQSSGSINQPPNVKVSGTQFTGSTNLSSLDDIGNWLFCEDSSFPVVADGAFASELNVPSPGLSTIDTDMLLFDFEDSWNGLAHA